MDRRQFIDGGWPGGEAQYLWAVKPVQPLKLRHNGLDALRVLWMRRPGLMLKKNWVVDKNSGHGLQMLSGNFLHQIRNIEDGLRHRHAGGLQRRNFPLR